ncbi:MAG: transposase [Kiritimatiellae bacterium]|jgi:putative transposase|nr:transposase [Kiritimatiellia bacterium]
MRLHRIKLEEAATYHVMSRVIEHRFIFGDAEKSYLYNLMRRLESFTGCEVRTYAFMDDHFHVLLHVPENHVLSDAEVKRRAKILYGKKKFAIMEKSWELWIEKACEEKVKAQLDGFRVRMYDLSEFMKTFKQRFSIYYNANHDRRSAGPLWHDRFKSILVEEKENAQVTVAAYIDLNPVRAGVVKDPKDYRWSGYAEAVAKGGFSRERISKLFINRDLTGRQVLSEYRQHLYYEGARRIHEYTGAVTKPGFKRDLVDKILEEGGELSVIQLLNCKVRYFSDGVIIGSKDYVERMLDEHKDQFSRLRRKRGAHKMKNGEKIGLCTACELRSRAIIADRQ